ncbi:unnamed protein product [Mytilus coruscus]|uniref:Uncharacterized protein n=1 Tax=Mytilus coruscus TaxID=42192 RepID=A0A6J8CZ21_MYTCO|nr:unnamed protein product [Mytilus coruscus]
MLRIRQTRCAEKEDEIEGVQSKRIRLTDDLECDDVNDESINNDILNRSYETQLEHAEASSQEFGENEDYGEYSQNTSECTEDYFPWDNFTEAALSVFFESSGISEKQFGKLLQIISNDKFEKDHIPESVYSIKKKRSLLPVLKVHQNNTENEKEGSFYYFDVENIVNRIISSESSLSTMTFVPISPLNGEMSEVCHSQLYKQSPLFSVIQSLTIGSIIYRIEDFIKFSADRKIRIGKIHSFCFDSGKKVVINVKLYLRGLEVRNHYSYTSITSKKDQIFLTDVIDTVEKEHVIKKITCPSEISGMYFLSKHEEQNFTDSSFHFISDEIPWFEDYSFQKDVPKPDIPKGVPVLILYLHLYFDGFGLYRRKYHSTNGFYMSVGNLPRREGAKRASMHVIGLGEPNSTFNDCFECVEPFIKKLQKGYMTTSAYGPVFVVGGIGEINADMPQANACANCLGPTANKRCRFCSISKEFLCYADAADPEATERRTKERTMETIVEMTTMSDQEKNRCQTETGVLMKQNPLFEKEIFFEPHIQVRIDHFHLDLLGVSRLQIGLILENVRASTKDYLQAYTSVIDLPSWFVKLPELKHISTATGQEIAELVQLWPVICRNVMTVDLFGRNAKAFFESNRVTDVHLHKHNQLLAEYLSMIYSTSITRNQVERLHDTIRRHHMLMKEIWGEDICNRGNIHCGFHSKQDTILMGHPKIPDCNRFERHHHCVKDLVLAHCNGKNVEKSAVSRLAVVEAIKHVLSRSVASVNYNPDEIAGYVSMYTDDEDICLIPKAELVQHPRDGKEQSSQGLNNTCIAGQISQHENNCSSIEIGQQKWKYGRKVQKAVSSFNCNDMLEDLKDTDILNMVSHLNLPNIARLNCSSDFPLTTLQSDNDSWQWSTKLEKDSNSISSGKYAFKKMFLLVFDNF